MNTQEDANRVNAAFSRVELLAIVCLAAIMAQLQVAALNKSGGKSRLAVCANNQNQLIRAWLLYSEDNNGLLVRNYFGSLIPSGANASTWVVGGLDWGVAASNTNTLYLTSDNYCKLARYLGYDTNVFHCPADNYVSAIQANRGWQQRLRSYSMNLNIGDSNQDPSLAGSIYKTFRRSSEFLYPSPDQTWVFIEDHPDSINDPAFVNPGPKIWFDRPAAHHEGAASLAFADGHVEVHRWTGSLSARRAQIVTFTPSSSISTSQNDADIHWISYRAGRVSTNSY